MKPLDYLLYILWVLFFWECPGAGFGVGDVPFTVPGGGVEVVEGEVESKRESSTILHTIKSPTPHQHVVGEHRDDLGAAADDFVGFANGVLVHNCDALRYAMFQYHLKIKKKGGSSFGFEFINF